MSGVTTVMEDYLEKIYTIRERKGFVRVKDIARELNVSAPSVTEMLHKLGRQKLIRYERYQPVLLTSRGERIAKSTHMRHETLTLLLKMILVSDGIAEEDACKIEHQLSPETIEQLSKFVGFMRESVRQTEWPESFRAYCASHKKKS
ncbi:MAG: metal-dependent transcriptional regulator [Candidatus Altiarchaeota archaeon]